jgi:2-phosphoglycerate kinase
MIGEKIEDVIKIKVEEVLNQRETPEILDLIETDNIGEVIEKLCILHIRMWMLEDKCALAQEDKEIASIKRKIDICFKDKRPKFVQAVNRMIDKSIKENKSLVEDSVKFYEGHKSEKEEKA